MSTEDVCNKDDTVDAVKLDGTLDSLNVAPHSPTPAIPQSKQQQPLPKLPYIRFKSPIKGGRKVLGNIVSVIILIISVLYTVVSFVYYSSPPANITGSYANSLKELFCSFCAVLLVLSRFFHVRNRENPLNLLLGSHRETVSLVVAAVSAVAHFAVLVRWYVQEGRVYVWHFQNLDVPYTLNWQVRFIMSMVVANFILNFSVFSLMLLTKMRPKYKDLNPHLTAFIAKQPKHDSAINVTTV